MKAEQQFSVLAVFDIHFSNQIFSQNNLAVSNYREYNTIIFIKKQRNFIIFLQYDKIKSWVIKKA